MTEKRLRYAALVTVTLIALLFHLPSLLIEPNPNEGDGPTYMQVAKNLARGLGFVAPDPVSSSYGHPAEPRHIAPYTLRTPGYPALLAAVLALGLPLRLIVVCQHLLCVAMTPLVFLLTERATGGLRGGLIAALLFALFPPLPASAHQYMTEVFTAAIVLSAILAAWRATRKQSIWWATVAGLLTGGATLLRPIALLWFVPLGAIVFVRTRLVALSFLLAALLLPGAWMLRNYEATGVATISSIGGEVALFNRAAAALVVHDAPPGFGFLALQHQFGLYRNVDKLKPMLLERAFVEARHDGVDPIRAPHALLARYYGRVARDVLLHHIPEMLELMVSGSIEIFIGPYLFPARLAWGLWIEAWIAIAFGAAVFAAACYGLVILARTDATLAGLFSVTIIYFTVLAAGEGAEMRFVVPFAPAYMVAAGIGIDQLFNRRAPWQAATA